MRRLQPLFAGKLRPFFLITAFLIHSPISDAGRLADYPGMLRGQSQAAEYLDWSSARINGTLHFLTTTDSLYQLIGRPDSVVTPDLDEICVSFYDKHFKYGYFRGIVVEMYGDTSVVTAINFKDNPGMKVITASIIMDRSTTLSDVARVYPNAVRDKHEIDIYGYGKALVITLNTSQLGTDDAWMLIFSNDHLIRLDYWMPC